MRDLVDAICEPLRSEDNRPSCERDRVPPFGPWRDDSKLQRRRETAYPYGDPLAAAAPAQSSARQARESALETPAAERGHTWPPYQRHGKTSAGDNPGADVSDPPDKRHLLWWPRVPGGVSLAIAAITGSVRASAWGTYQGHEKTAVGDKPRADVSDPPDQRPLLWWPRVPGGASLAIAAITGSVRASAWRTYQRYEKTAVGDKPRADVSDPPDKRPLLWWPRAPSGAGLIIVGIAGSVLIGALAAVSYFAVGAANAPGPAPAIAYSSSVKAKAATAAQKDSSAASNERAPRTSSSDQPNKVRTVIIRPDIGAANMSPAESTNVESELNTAVVSRAYPNAAEQRDVGAASAPAAAFSDPRSEPNVPAASRAGTSTDAQKNVRASAARPQVAARSGGIACEVSRGSGGYWAWRLIDGKKCWYKGKPGMSKDNLRWVPRAA